MANYGPVDQVVDHGISFTVYNFTTGDYDIYDFGAAGYAADAILNTAADGQVQIFGATTPDFLDAITVKVGGSNVVLDGTGSAFAKRDHLVVTNCYFKYNLPDTQNRTYFFKAVFSFGSGASQQTFSWQNSTLQ